MQKHRGIWLALLLALLAAAVLAPVAAMASGTGDVAINENNFPDEKFRAYVQSELAGGDDVLSPKEIAAVTEINVQRLGISNLTGIKHFTALEKLYCYSNDLTSLDLSGCTALETLICYDNDLTSLNVSGCTALTYLECDNNKQLTTLDVSHCKALKTLWCHESYLTSLNVSGCTALEELYCYKNQLTSLDVSGCTELTYLDCYNNDLTSLNVSGCTKLEELHCYENQLTSLDVSGCTALTYLHCYRNNLTTLNVSQNTKLEYLYCYENRLTTLDVSQNTALIYLNCYENQLTTLTVSGLTALEYLYCYENQLTTLDVSGCTALWLLTCSGNQLTSLDVSQNTVLKQLTCHGNALTTLDVSDCTALEYLYCNDNRLTSLDVSQNTALKSLNCIDQTAQLGVDRGADGTWSANLAELIGPNVSNVVTTTPGAAVQGTTVAWSGLGVRPAVTYDFDTGFTDASDPDNPRPVMMNVTLTLVPLGMGTEADVTGASVKNIAGVVSGTEITVQLPAGSPLPTAGDIAVTLSPYATMTNPATADGGHTWTFTVTSEDEQTVKNYTLYIVYGVTVESGEDDHGTVTASPNPARMGDTVTLTVTPDPGYMLTGWEVVLGGVTVREDNTFVMPAGGVILRPIFAPIPTPPQTGDDSHTGLWLALLLASLGGLCAAAYAVRRRRGGAR